MKDRFVFRDFETTGLDPGHDRVIEIGAIRYTTGGAEIGAFEQLVNPGIEVPSYSAPLGRGP